MIWQYLLALCVVYCTVNDGVHAGFQRRIIYRGQGAPMGNTGGCGSGPPASNPVLLCGPAAVIPSNLSRVQPINDSKIATKPPSKPIKKAKRVKLTTDMKQKFVDAHNKARSSVTPPAADMVPVEWDEKIASVANKFVKKCEFIHSKGSERTIKSFQYPLGENLFAGMSSMPSHTDPEYITKQWDDERKYYNIGSLSCTPGKMCGHYTQVVWSTTKKIGCAIAVCPSLKGTRMSMLNVVAVCNYGPTGNWVGQKPYKIGAACSSCPADSTNQCKNSLCY